MEALVTKLPGTSQSWKDYSTFLIRIHLGSGNFFSLQDDNNPYMQYYFFPLEFCGFKSSAKTKYSKTMLTTNSAEAKSTKYAKC